MDIYGYRRWVHRKVFDLMDVIGRWTNRVLDRHVC